MRTTIEMPDALFRDAKVRAAAQGRTLKSLICDAIRRDLASTAPTTPAKRKSPFPLVRFNHPHPVDLSGFDLDDLLT